MATEAFTRDEFEQALDRIGAYYGLSVNQHSTSGDEFSYKLYPDSTSPINIYVRSSVSVRTGIADATGKDSIRLYLMNGDRWLSQVDAWTQRIPNWESRMMEKVRYLLDLWKQAGCCQCGEPNKIYKVTDKRKPTYGKLYAKCDHYKQRGDGHTWKWLNN